MTEAKKSGIRRGLFAAVGTGLIFFIMFSVYSLAFWYGSKLVREGDMSVGNMIIVSFWPFHNISGIENITIM